MAINTYLSVVALNVNELNDQKIQSVRWDNKRTYNRLPVRDPLQRERQIESEWMEKDISYEK